MASIQVHILSDNEIQGIHRASLAMLRDTGILIHHEEVLRSLGENGAKVDCDREIARFPEKLVMDCVARAGKRYILHGRNPARVARFGYGDLNQMSSPGQYGWIDSETHAHRTATLEDRAGRHQAGRRVAEPHNCRINGATQRGQREVPGGRADGGAVKGIEQTDADLGL